MHFTDPFTENDAELLVVRMSTETKARTRQEEAKKKSAHKQTQHETKGCMRENGPQQRLE